MTTLYVDNIAPNLQSKISAPNLTLPTGSIIQVVRLSNWNTTINSDSATWTDAASISITPKYSNSLILVSFNFQARLRGSANVECRGGFRLLRDSTVIFNTLGNRETMHINQNGTEYETMMVLNQMDAPNTTSSVTYKSQARLLGGTHLYQWDSTYGGAIFAMEIAG